MMTLNADKKRKQIQMFCMDDMVPQNHILCMIDKTIDWNFIYELVVDKYSLDNDSRTFKSLYDKIITQTNREGYREYKSCGIVCGSCPHLGQCTKSKEHVKIVTRHVWEAYMEKSEDIRHTLGMKELYALRKTIERIFD